MFALRSATRSVVRAVRPAARVAARPMSTAVATAVRTRVSAAPFVATIGASAFLAYAMSPAQAAGVNYDEVRVVAAGTCPP